MTKQEFKDVKKNSEYGMSHFPTIIQLKTTNLEI